MSKKDGKDCKHEKIIPLDEDGNEIELDFFWCDVCNNANFTSEDIVIRTKAYDQEREDVIGAARKMVKLKDTISELDEALDALGGK